MTSDLTSTIRVAADGTVTRGIEVPHEGANIRGKLAADRIVATPPRVSRTRRFAPSGIPKGVDQTITLPHDCGNHLRDVEDIARGF